MKQDITTLEDVKLLVNTFYDKVMKDNVLANIFNNKIGNKWPEHLDKMYRFWQTVLLEEHSYHGSPFIPHAKLPVTKEHFIQWLALFNETIDVLFEGELASKAKWEGERMAEMFYSKIEFHKNNASSPLI